MYNQELTLHPEWGTPQQPTPLELVGFIKCSLLEQGEASEDDEGDPKYSGPNGLRCAVGWCLSGEYYRPEFEDFSVDGGAETSNLLREAIAISLGWEDGSLPVGIEAVLSTCQSIHDATPVQGWAEKFDALLTKLKAQ